MAHQKHLAAAMSAATPALAPELQLSNDNCSMRLLMHISAPVVQNSQCVLMQCVHDDGRAETRICRFENLILYRSQLLYIYSGKRLHSAEAHNHDIWYLCQWPVQTCPAFTALQSASCMHH